MAGSVTWDTLRELAGFRSETGCALSLYLDLDPSASPTRAEAQARLRALLAQAEKAFASNGAARAHGAKVAVGRDLARIRDWWDGEFARDGALGLALFASDADGLWRVEPLPAAVPDAVHLGAELFVAPLVAVADSDEGALVAVVGRERGQVFRLRGGRLVEVVDQSEEQPGRHDQGGWAQARYQRHIEKLVADHLRAVGGEIDRHVRAARGPRLVVVAPEELRPELEASLSPAAREAVVGWTSADAHATEAELLAAVRGPLAAARAARLQAVLERWREERGRAGRASAGWAPTLTAASDGRVAMLLLPEGVRRRAFRCPACGRADAAAGTCPLDGAAREPADGVELAVHRTVAAGGVVLRLPPAGLDGAEVGALLRF